MENFEKQKKYARAKKRVHEEKGFYSHLTAYIIVNVFLLFINSDFIDEGFSNWLNWNLYLTPFFWGIGLFFHWIKVFNPNIIFSKQWEDRKIKEIMDNDNTTDFL
ncbi:2TM domain-containing protein [Aquimarina sp. 2201CG14-23]|uniref:2TM domain-containing protein n=1 Tax=Aquimarina mycalae TaxID=3040073 RepID=UPI002477D395|nr:2TM domain-containing protein [Aquimarina sp. 2201CG14-23]MDH7447088.1 2TM domain-containing protein [Aquimarina sp. 2201CG14-23]